MKSFVEIELNEAVMVFGGRNEETAKVVEFIAQCIGSVAKMIYLANRLRKMLSNPASAML